MRNGSTCCTLLRCKLPHRRSTTAGAAWCTGHRGCGCSVRVCTGMQGRHKKDPGCACIGSPTVPVAQQRTRVRRRPSAPQAGGAPRLYRCWCPASPPHTWPAGPPSSPIHPWPPHPCSTAGRCATPLVSCVRCRTTLTPRTVFPLSTRTSTDEVGAVAAYKCLPFTCVEGLLKRPFTNGLAHAASIWGKHAVATIQLCCMHAYDRG